MKNIYIIFLLLSLMACQALAQTKINLISDLLTASDTLTAEQDHARLMKLLNIDSLQPGPSWKTADPNAVKTYESKANSYPNLPDFLRLNNGKEITSTLLSYSEINYNRAGINFCNGKDFFTLIDNKNEKI